MGFGALPRMASGRSVVEHAMTERETITMLIGSTLPKFIWATAKIMASALIAEGVGTAWMSDFLGAEGDKVL